MALTAGWAIISTLIGLVFLVDSSLPGGPHAPVALFAAGLVCGLPVIIGGTMAVWEERTKGMTDGMLKFGLLARLPRGLQIAVAVAFLAWSAVWLTGAVRVVFGPPVFVEAGTTWVSTEVRDEILRDSRAERRFWLGSVMTSTAVSGGLCWSAKLRDDEEDPL